MSLNLVDPELDLIDPNPDIYEHFNRYNRLLFNDRLGRCEVKWSKRMTLCAGNCRYKPRSGECIISLSEPLLKLRPRCDFVNTLLHEMIHAYLFVTKRNQDRDGHGPDFQLLMRKINSMCGTSITIYHTFNAEVRHYKTHVWRCNGPCSRRPPFWGYVRRSMNRTPSRNDYWWSEHVATCGGSFIKVKEPENYNGKKTSKTGSCRNEVSKTKTIVNGILISSEKPKSIVVSPKTIRKTGIGKNILSPKFTGNKETTLNGRNNGNGSGIKQLFPKNASKPSFFTPRKRVTSNSVGSPASRKIIKLPSACQASMDGFVVRTPKVNTNFQKKNTDSNDKDIIYLGTTSKAGKLGVGTPGTQSFLKKLHQERLQRMNKLL
uniref:SprT-like domain-containing protein Spartan (projected from Caenorhabditis elegans ortholog dvc-1) n=1 Tax=Strongyloides venezuelensis TaxID=75913 RepID=A0A0K0FAQ7_STRVS